MDKRTLRRGKSPLRKVINCRQCLYTFKHTTTKNYAICPNCGRQIDARDRSESQKKYYEKNPERAEKFKKYVDSVDMKKHRNEQNRKERIKVLLLVGKMEIKCVRCGCDNIPLLEINHINGGGLKEFEGGKYAREFYRKIIRLERKVDDLEILCRVCNAWHYLELKTGKKQPFEVIWNG